jgi:alpha-beta hydrolase superfamily lysophospholipase
VTVNPVPVEIEGANGAILRGQRWSGDAYWVLLLHDVGPDEDLDRWRPLVGPLVAGGYGVLTLDLRGHGASEGEWNATLAERDLEAAVTFARSGGAAHVALGAIGSTAVVALRAATELELDALLVLSPALPDWVAPRRLRAPGVPKLLLTGSGDATITVIATRLRNASIGWALNVTLPTTAQGADLLSSEARVHLREHVLGFLGERRYLARRARARTTISDEGGAAG